MLTGPSIASAHRIPLGLRNNGAMGEIDIRETRRRRLLEFAEPYASDADAARKLGIDPSYFSQMKNHHRPIGEKIARAMEEAAGLDRGWFDGNMAYLTDEEARMLRRFRRLPPERREHILGWLALERSMTPTQPMAPDDPPAPLYVVLETPPDDDPED